MEKLQSDLIDETDFLYVLRKNAYEKCVEQISNLEKRIDETKALINKSVAAENNQSGDDAGSVSSGESQNPLSGITPRNVFSAMMDLECLMTTRFPMRTSLIRTTVFICHIFILH